MNRVLILSLVAAFGLVALAGTAPAQPKPGDVLFSCYGSSGQGMYYTTWPGSHRTLKSGFTLNAVTMMGGNAYAYMSGGAVGYIYRLASNGTHYTINKTISASAGIALDQDGTYMIPNNSDRKVYRLSGTTASVWVTISSTYGVPNAICRDGNTGDFIVGTFNGSSGYLVRVSRTSRSYSDRD